MSPHLLFPLVKWNLHTPYFLSTGKKKKKTGIWYATLSFCRINLRGSEVLSKEIWGKLM